MKQGRLLLFTIIFVGVLFFWAIWEAFLDPVVPQTRVWFKDFEAFQDKAKSYVFSVSLPESQENIKYYYHSEWFQYLSGFSVSLSNDDYKQYIESCIEEHQSDTISNESEKYLYLYNENDIQYAEEDVLVKNDITFCNRLLLKNEKIEDFYYIYGEKVESTHEFYDCVLANDSDNRIMVLSFINKNPQYDK
ncbi:MAG: hypothetical protein K2M78_10480 [Lachnospiraceae bacterium]|nr:hypothetical protein [Lachnospiraceae bacterium]